MRSILRALPLFFLLLAYSTQVVGQAQHLHISEDRHHCTVCHLGTVPGEPPARTVGILPPEFYCFAGIVRSKLPPPPRPLAILDVSHSTSPPYA